MASGSWVDPALLSEYLATNSQCCESEVSESVLRETLETCAALPQVRSGQVRFITRPKSRTMRAKRKKRSRANRTKVPK